MDERRVYIAQLMCPSRHCIVALAGEYDALEAALVLEGFLREQFKRVTDAGAVNKWCGICQSDVFHVEIGRTKWTTIQEAQPHIDAMEELNAMSSEIISKQQLRAGRN